MHNTLCRWLSTALACTMGVAAWAAASPDPQEAKVAAAVSAAEDWLGKMDAGRHDSTWQEAAELFRLAVSQAQWEQSLKAARTPLGKCLSRRLKNTAYHTRLPGAPDGQYVVIQFDTSFEHKQAAVETVTPMLEKDGTWRVSGYYIK